MLGHPVLYIIFRFVRLSNTARCFFYRHCRSTNCVETLKSIFVISSILWTAYLLLIQHCWEDLPRIEQSQLISIFSLTHWTISLFLIIFECYHIGHEVKKLMQLFSATVNTYYHYNFKFHEQNERFSILFCLCLSLNARKNILRKPYSEFKIVARKCWHVRWRKILWHAASFVRSLRINWFLLFNKFSSVPSKA